MVAMVQNPVGAAPGDVVSIYLKESALRAGAVLLYIIPILWLMAGAFVGDGLGGDWRIGTTGAAVLGGATGLALGFLMALGISRSLRFGPGMVPKITRVVERAGTAGGDGHAEIDTTANAACCR